MSALQYGHVEVTNCGPRSRDSTTGMAGMVDVQSVWQAWQRLHCLVHDASDRGLFCTLTDQRQSFFAEDSLQTFNNGILHMQYARSTFCLRMHVCTEKLQMHGRGNGSKTVYPEMHKTDFDRLHDDSKVFTVGCASA